MDNQKFSEMCAPEKYAQFWKKETTQSKAIPYPPSKHSYRSLFACERDKVLYCSAFRRMSAKTQVFNYGTTDNLRTRLTHSLEVSQIACTLSKELGLDIELTEAIALAHDIGHTPFGHVGERTINKFSQGDDKRFTNNDGLVYVIPTNCVGFKHNLQSVRVLVDYSQKVKYVNYLLYGVREHSKRFWNTPSDVQFYNFYDVYCSFKDDNEKLYPSWSFEAFIVAMADEVAQRHHDIEDAFLQKILSPEDIIEKLKPLSEIVTDETINSKYERLIAAVDKLCRKASVSEIGFTHTLSSFVIDAYVTILLKEFRRVLKHFKNVNNISNKEMFEKLYLSFNEEDIREMMELKNTPIKRVDKILGKSLKYAIVDSYEVQKMDGKGAFIIRKLLRAYISNPQQLPNDYINRIIKIELLGLLSHSDYQIALCRIREELGTDYKENVLTWKDYECRNALRCLMDKEQQLVMPALIRVIFDYISKMTDTFALSEYKKLY
jgi:dGTPase